ncbi:MAG: peroxiredoxin [Candidatus Caenarcaniphilales bacterium]|nr:peroxiredoxin [Candidatus Caenarcaniphilales bacterium]
MNKLKYLIFCITFSFALSSCASWIPGLSSTNEEKISMKTELAVGDIAPDFTLLDQNSKEQSLSSYQGKYVLIYFYPKDDTPGCTMEACSIRDNINEFKNLDVQVFGISGDSPESHQKFIKKYNLPFDLLSDPKKVAVKAYDADGLFIKRISYLIDREGNILKFYPNVNPSKHAAEILADIKSI